MYAINRGLPDDIRVLSLSYVPLSFHSRFSAKKKEYRYYIKFQNYSVFEARYKTYIKNLNYDLMVEAIKLFLGEHDLQAFVALM